MLIDGIVLLIIDRVVRLSCFLDGCRVLFRDDRFLDRLLGLLEMAVLNTSGIRYSSPSLIDYCHSLIVLFIQGKLIEAKGTVFEFSKPVVGIVSKIDHPKSNIKRARSYLQLAGCTTIYEVSAFTGEGMEDLVLNLNQKVNEYKELNARRYADDYFD